MKYSDGSEFTRPFIEADMKEDSQATSETPLPRMAEEAYHGLAGELVRMIEPHSEASPVGLLIHILLFFGNLIGRRPHYEVGGDVHRTNLNSVLVGPTASRKGSARADASFAMRPIDQEWFRGNIQSGLSTGAGLIWHVRDEIKEPHQVKEKGRIVAVEMAVSDPGVKDKRLLVIEPEFSSVLRVMSRDGNNLSAVIREAFDSGDLATLTKEKSARATGSHISIIGHVTQEELLNYLTQTETSNGFANRFLWLLVKRSKQLPKGGRLRTLPWEDIQRRLEIAAGKARATDLMLRDEEAEELWATMYGRLAGDRRGVFGAVTARAEALVLRLSMIYALLDGSPDIQVPHLRAALAMWWYAEASAEAIFGASVGDVVADRILKGLRSALATGMTRSEINLLLNGKVPTDKITRALDLLRKLGKVYASQGTSTSEGGRRAEVWYAKN